MESPLRTWAPIGLSFFHVRREGDRFVLPGLCAGPTIDTPKRLRGGWTGGGVVLITTPCPWCGQRATGLAQVADP
jgi:hypothetical protein